jgi:hypothetical protein
LKERVRKGTPWGASPASVLDWSPAELKDRALASVIKMMYPNVHVRHAISAKRQKAAPTNTEHTAWRYRWAGPPVGRQ